MRPSVELVPDDVLDVLRRLRGEGKQAFLAGGAVRDLVRVANGECDAVPQDFDVATDALPEDVQRLFPRTAPTGIAHGTVTVLTGAHSVEVTTFRGEGPYLDGRRPSSVTFRAPNSAPALLRSRSMRGSAAAISLATRRISDRRDRSA